MKFKENYENTIERFDAFWQLEETDRCLIAVTSSKKGVMYPAPDNIMLEQKWLDADYRIERLEREYNAIYWGGEAIPACFVNLGPGVIASFVGSDFVLAENTIWFDHNPLIINWENRSELKLDTSCKMWNSMSEIYEKLYQKGIFAGITDLGGNLDLAASLRGSEKLLVDLIDNPDEVKKLLEEIDNIWIDVVKRIFNKFKKHQNGYTSWMPLWCRDTWYPLQCDFSVMISPNMFEEFVKPSLCREAAILDKVVYHLDGPGQIQHLDHILDIPGINAIELVPMPDENGYLDAANEKWFPIYKKIQEKGKGLVLRCIDPLKLEKLLTSISHKGLFVSTHVRSEEDVDDLLKVSIKWAKNTR